MEDNVIAEFQNISAGLLNLTLHERRTPETRYASLQRSERDNQSDSSVVSDEDVEDTIENMMDLTHDEREKLRDSFHNDNMPDYFLEDIQRTREDKEDDEWDPEDERLEIMDELDTKEDMLDDLLYILKKSNIDIDLSGDVDIDTEKAETLVQTLESEDEKMNIEDFKLHSTMYLYNKLSGKNLVEESGEKSILGLQNNTFAISKEIDKLITEQPGLKRKRDDIEALSEIRSEQMGTDLIIESRPFKRLVYEITNNYSETVCFTKEAIEALQVASEDYLIRMFQNTGLVGIHAQRTNVKPRDIKVVKYLGLLD